MINLDSILKSRRHDFANKGPSSQSYGFSSRHVWMWEVDHKESWVPKNWCFWTVVVEKMLGSPSDCKEIKPVHPKGNQPWISLEGLMLKLKLHYFGHLMWRANSLEETLMLEKGEGKREEGGRGWDNWIASLIQWTWTWENSRRYEGQGGLVCYTPRSGKESDTT